MAVSYVERGRAEQKRRTRAAILEAATDLVTAGHTPTVPDAAAAAGVSRATAYRYFPTQESLLVEVTTTGLPSAADVMLGDLAGSDDAEARVAAVVESLTSFMVEREPGLRTMLRVSLERGVDPSAGVPVREGRRAAYLEQAMAPLRDRLSPEALRRTNAAIGMVVGTEALVVLRDIYDFETAEALELMRWAAAVLYRAAASQDAQ